MSNFKRVVALNEGEFSITVTTHYQSLKVSLEINTNYLRTDKLRIKRYWKFDIFLTLQ